MRKLTLLAAMAAATAITSPALAGNPDGKLQVKVLATGVLPDGKISSVQAVNNTTTLGAAAIALGPQTKASDNVVPTLAVEYFATPNVSVETICCFTQHHVNASSPVALAGANLVNHVLILPATVTVKYHLNARVIPATFTLKYHLNAGPIKPYLGIGPSVFFVLGEKPGADARALNVTKVKMSNSIGFALQGGVDIPVTDTGMGISLDAKKYFVKPTAKFYEGNTLALETKHKLNPWVVSGGVYLRF